MCSKVNLVYAYLIINIMATLIVKTLYYIAKTRITIMIKINLHAYTYSDYIYVLACHWPCVYC